MQGSGQEPETQIPDFSHFNTVELENLDISFSGVNSEDIPISIDVDPQNSLYVLTLGNGIQRRDPEGNVINANFISGLRSPLDFAIDSNGFFYVADYSEDGGCFENGKIKIFNPDGSFNRQFFTGFYRPLGIEIDSEGHIYVAEYNQPGSGCESDELSRISVYNSSGTRISFQSNVSRPYRIAVNSNKTVYVSQEGDGNPAVLILDQDLNITGNLSNIQSPGSVVVDAFDFIHVVEYANRIDFSRFINFEELSTGEIQEIAKEIDRAIDDNAFFLKVYNPDENFEFQYQEELDFPVDIAFNSCDRMYVNDGYVNGSNIPFFGYFPQKIAFYLDIFERTPAFDIIVPEIACPSNVTVQAEAGNDFAVVNYPDATATDLCGVNVNRTAGLPSGSQFPIGENSVEFTATDSFGNFSTCTFTIMVNPPENNDVPPSFSNCPTEDFTLSNNSGECGAVVSFSTPTATDEDGSVEVVQIAGLSSGSLFPVGTTTVTFSATDDENNTTNCTFTISILDEEKPVLTCPGDIVETVPYGATGKIIDYSIASEDNCDGFSWEQTEGLPSGSEFPIGTTLNVFEITDAAENTSTCSFSVTIEEAEDTEPPILNCPADFQLNSDGGVCGAVVEFPNPTATDNSGGEITIERIDNENYISGNVFPVGTTIISYRATDEAGNSSECSFEITVEDVEKPVLNCVTEFSINLQEDETRILEPQELLIESSDNCAISEFNLSKELFTEADEGMRVVTLTATDASGNIATCEVSLEVKVERGQDLSLNCPGEYEVFANSNCEYIIPDFSGIVGFSPDNAPIDQSIPPGAATITNADPFVTITASFEDKTETCNIYLLLKDEVPPLVNCPLDKTVSLEEGESFTLEDYRGELNSTDNCGIVQISQEPPAGTPIEEDTEITFTVMDEAGNRGSCSIQIEVVSESELSIICPEDRTEELGDNCSFEVRDYRDDVEVFNGEEAVITQTPEPGTIVTGEQIEVILRAEKNEQFDECSFTVNLVDVLPPVPACKDYELILGEGEIVDLVPQVLDDGSSDNCGDISYSLSKTQFSAADEGENQVILTVIDAAGNMATCEAKVLVTVSDYTVNQPPVPMDEEYTTTVNTSLNVSAENGVLVNDVDPDGDQLTAILETSTEFGNLQLNEDGSFTYTPNAEFIGQDFFTYRASDGELLSDVIFVSINVVDENADFSCNSQIIIHLDEEGLGEVEVDALFQGNADGLNFSLNRMSFSCEDLGEAELVLEYTGRLEGRCEIGVMVIDDIKPVLKLKDISIDLDLEGNASIKFEDIDNGSTDNCEVEYRLGRSTFTCKDLGSNSIEVLAEDKSGNISTGIVNIQVFAEAGICTDPVTGSEYIFLYPNPTTDKFSVATPGDVTIHRIEVFDKRGRFITARNFNSGEREYSVDLMPLQEAVYVLKIKTNEGQVVKRLIFKH